MALPYENATSGNRALDDIQKILTKFGASRFGTMTDTEAGILLVQFTYRSRDGGRKVDGYWVGIEPVTFCSKDCEVHYQRKVQRAREMEKAK